MNKSLIAFALILISAASLIADELRKRAEENPLDCAIYLAVKKDRFRDDQLMHVLLETGRYDDLLRYIDQSDSYSAREVAELAAKLRAKGKTEEANRFLEFGMQVLRNNRDSWDNDSTGWFARELAAMNREPEVLEILENQEDDEEVDLLLKISEGFQTAGKSEKSILYLTKASELQAAAGDPDDIIEIARRFLKLGQKEKTLEVLSSFEKVNDASLEINRDRLYLEAASIYVRLGNLEKATSLWQQHRDPNEGFDSLAFASILDTSGYKDRAEPIFLQLALDKGFLDSYGGSDLTKIYFNRGDIETARAIALSISIGNDSYHQQESLLAVADKLLSLGDRNGAIKILAIAEKKARKVGEEHRTQDSIGASPLTRKVIYLRQLRNRYFTLDLFEKGLALANAIKVKDRHIQDFVSEGILQSAELRVKSLSRKQLDRILKQALDVFDNDEDYYRMRAKLRMVSIYVKIGDKAKALEISNEILAGLKSGYRIDDLLPELGKIFEESKLQPNAKTRQLLEDIIEEEVGE